MLNELAAILLRYRLNSFACTSDISKAFLIVGLHETDTCRFFWPSDSFNNSKIATYRFKVIFFGSTASQVSFKLYDFTSLESYQLSIF